MRPTAAFGREILVDQLAAGMGDDSIELRRINALVDSEAAVNVGPCPVSGAREVLERIKEHPLWASRDSLPENEGIGFAAGHWPGGLEPAAAVCRVNADGTMTVVTSAADMSGVNTGFAVIAAAAFGLAPDD